MVEEMAFRLSRPVRQFALVAVVVGIVTILAFAAYVLVFSTITVSGVVDHKTIVGIRDDCQYTLVVIVPWGIQVQDSALQSLFSDKDVNLTIDESLEWDIRSCGYAEIRYLASVRLSTGDSVNDIEPGGTLAYFVKRDDFNKLVFIDDHTISVEKLEFATIRDVD